MEATARESWAQALAGLTRTDGLGIASSVPGACLGGTPGAVGVVQQSTRAQVIVLTPGASRTVFIPVRPADHGLMGA